MRMLDISLASQSQTGLEGGDGGLGGTTVTGGLVSHRGHHTWRGGRQGGKMGGKLVIRMYKTYFGNSGFFHEK